MGDFKFASNLFLEVAELNRLKKFLRNDGYQLDFKNGYETMGIVRNQYYDPNFNYFQVVDISVPGSVKVNPGFAYDLSRNVISSNGVTLVVPSPDTWYWLKVAYNTNNTEKGTVTIGGSSGGLMTGLSTEFTKVLRGQPNFPSKISFVSSTNYVQQYEILEVVDDNTVYLQGSFPTQETGLQYQIVGTFTPGTNPAAADQYPFIYDDFTYTFVPETQFNTAPTTIAGAEFFIARLQNASVGGLVLQDKRYLSLAQTRAERLYQELPANANPLIAIESVTRTSLFQKVYFTVNLHWGFRVGQENRYYNQNKVTVISGNGGAYATANAFTTGDFDNWRYYYASGEYSKIISSVKNGNGIDLFLDSLKSESVGSLICPNAEEIEIQLSYNVSVNSSNQVYKTKVQHFYTNTLNPQLIIDQDELDPNILEVDLQHRFKTMYRLTALANLKQSLYSVAGATPILSNNVILTAGAVLPVGTTAWRGINPGCILDSFGTPIYYKVTTQNAVIIPTTYTPNNTTPQYSTDETTVQVLVQFYSDAGRTTLTPVTHVNLHIPVLITTTTQAYDYSSWSSVAGGGTPSQSIRQTLNTYTISPVASNSAVLATLDSTLNKYFHPTQSTGTRNPITLSAITYAEFTTQLQAGNTGQKGFANLEQYVVATQLPTGTTKPNIASDPNYIAPVTDILNCPVNIQALQVYYYSQLRVQNVSLTGAVLGLQTTPAVADTQNGGYLYALPNFALNESVTISVNIGQTGGVSTGGFVWIRVVYSPTGGSGTVNYQQQVPISVATLLSQTFTNIQSVSISNY